MPAALGLNTAWGAEQWSPVLIEALSAESALLRAGVRRIVVNGRTAHVPRVAVLPEADWTAELAELPTDAGSADTVELVPKKIGDVIALSRESIEDAPIDQLDAVGRSLIRGVAAKLDATAFSADAATATKPAGLRAGTLPGAPGTPDIPTIIAAIGEVGAAGAIANAVFVNPADLTALRQEALTGSYATLADPTAPGIERVGGAQLYMTPGLTAGTAIVAAAEYILLGVRRDMRVDFSEHSAFSRDAVQARVTARLDWAIGDPNALYVIA